MKLYAVNIRRNWMFIFHSCHFSKTIFLSSHFLQYYAVVGRHIILLVCFVQHCLVSHILGNVEETSVVMTCGIRGSALPLGSRPCCVTLTGAEYLYTHFIYGIVWCINVVELKSSMSVRIIFCREEKATQWRKSGNTLKEMWDVGA